MVSTIDAVSTAAGWPIVPMTFAVAYEGAAGQRARRERSQAVTRQSGLLAIADGGTVFLDKLGHAAVRSDARAERAAGHAIHAVVALSSPRQTLSELAERLVLDRTTLTRSIARLERDGLVKTERGPELPGAAVDDHPFRVAVPPPAGWWVGESAPA